MISFKKFITETLILEMPHIMVGGKAVDLELEVHAKMNPIDFVKYIEDWVDGKSIQSKIPGFSMKVNANSINEFIKKILGNPFLKNFTVMHYSDGIWNELETMLRSKLVASKV